MKEEYKIMSRDSKNEEEEEEEQKKKKKRGGSCGGKSSFGYQFSGFIIKVL